LSSNLLCFSNSIRPFLLSWPYLIPHISVLDKTVWSAIFSFKDHYFLKDFSVLFLTKLYTVATRVCLFHRLTLLNSVTASKKVIQICLCNEVTLNFFAPSFAEVKLLQINFNLSKSNFKIIISNWTSIISVLLISKALMLYKTRQFLHLDTNTCTLVYVYQDN